VSDEQLALDLTPVTTADDDGISLYDWMQEDHRYRGALTCVAGPRSSGELGTGELIVTGVFSSSSLAGLFAVLKAWITTRRKASVRITISHSGVVMDYQGQDPKLAIEMLDRLRKDTG
jgi:hypothetical protein